MHAHRAKFLQIFFYFLHRKYSMQSLNELTSKMSQQLFLLFTLLTVALAYQAQKYVGKNTSFEGQKGRWTVLLESSQSTEEELESRCNKLTELIENATIKIVETDQGNYSFQTPLLFTTPYKTLRSGIIRSSLHGNGSQILISAIGVVLSNLNLTGSWEIVISDNSSLILQNMVVDSAVVSLGIHSFLSVEGSLFSRAATSLAPSALAVTGGPSTVTVRDTQFMDVLPGSLLSVAGDGNAIFLEQVYFQSAEPVSTWPYPDACTQRIRTVCLVLDGDGLLADVRRTSYRWCGHGGLTFTGSNSTLRVFDSSFFGGHSSGGSGILAAGPHLTVAVSHSAFSGHWADGLGGALLLTGDDGVLQLESCAVVGNQAGLGGAGVALLGAGARVVLRACNVTDNVLYTGPGGGLLLNGTGIGGIAEFFGCAFGRNVALTRGGGALVLSFDAVSVRGCHFEGNQAAAGAGASLEVRTANISSTVFARNVARGGDGGGFCYSYAADASASLEVRGSNFSDNFAGSGGGLSILTTGTAFLAGTGIVSNTALDQNGGGGIWFQTVDGISGSDASVAAGAGLIMSGCNVSSNQARGGDGGGIAVAGGALLVDGTAISANTAAGGGGGIALAGYPGGGSSGVARAAEWRVTRSHIFENAAASFGGGIVVRGAASSFTELASGPGIPIALLLTTTPAAGSTANVSVLCRGRGSIEDFNGVVIPVTLRTAALNGGGGGGGEVAAIGAPTVAYSSPVNGVNDSLALLFTVLPDSRIALVYLQARRFNALGR